MKKTKLLSLSVLALVFVSAVGLFWVSGFLHRPLPRMQAQVIEVGSGQSLSGITAQLSQRDLLGAGYEKMLRKVAVRGYDLVTGVSRRLHVGEYQLTPGDSLIDFLGRLERGDVIQRSFTLIEGWNIRDLRRALTKAPSLIKTLPGVSDEKLMQLLGLNDTPAEVWFAADTYVYSSGVRAFYILDRVLSPQHLVL